MSCMGEHLIADEWCVLWWARCKLEWFLELPAPAEGSGRFGGSSDRSHIDLSPMQIMNSVDYSLAWAIKTLPRSSLNWCSLANR